MTRFTVYEYVSVDGLDLPIFTGSFFNDEMGKDDAQLSNFLTNRYTGIARMLRIAIPLMDSEDVQVLYYKDAGNMQGWYTIEDGFLKYNEIESVSDFNLIA